MSDPKRVTIYLTDQECSLLDAICVRQNLSKSAAMRHLLIYQGLCGGDMPVTRRILALPDRERDAAMTTILTRYRAGDPLTPQKFREWVKETLLSADPTALEKGADLLLRKLLGEDKAA